MKARFAVVVGFAGLMGLTQVAAAEAVSFDVDSSQSSLTLSGAVRYYFSGSVFSYGPQAAGALVASYDGTIAGDLVGSSLSFAGGSSIIGLANPSGPFLPSGPGTTDVYGMVTAALNGTANNRVYDLALDLTGGVATDGSAFAGNVAYTGTTGGIFPFFDASPQSLAGVTATNTSSGLVTLTESAGVQTLTIPIDANLILFGNGTGVETRLTGSIVATRVVPEPSAATLLAGLVAATLKRRPRRDA